MIYEEEVEKTVSKTDILEYLALSATMLKNNGRALTLTKELLDLHPDHPRRLCLEQNYEQILKMKGEALLKG